MWARYLARSSGVSVSLSGRSARPLACVFKTPSARKKRPVQNQFQKLILIYRVTHISKPPESAVFCPPTSIRLPAQKGFLSAVCAGTLGGGGQCPRVYLSLWRH